MNTQNVSNQWRLIIGFYALFLWSACDPTVPGPTCDDDVPSVFISDGVCDPAIFNFFTLADPQPGDIPALADFCTTDYSISRVFRLPSPAEASTEALVVYNNFPAVMTVEIIGSNCEGNLPFLVECFTVEGIADVLNLNPPSNVEDLLVRIVAEPNGTGYVPGTFSRDVISVTALDFDPSAQFEFDDGTPISCDGGYLQRIILSAPSGNGDNIADAVGLPIVESCSCSDGTLFALDVPYGIDLESLKPKLKDRTTQALTDTLNHQFDLDYLVNIPNQDQTSFDPDDDIAFGNAVNCVEFAPANIESSTNPEDGVIVAFIDSGVDFDSWGPSVFGQNNYKGATPACWAGAGFSFSEYGYDLINNDPFPDPQNRHGTDVAGAFVNRYESDIPLTLLHLKFFNDSRGSYFDALCGSYLAEASGADIINWSWGFADEELPGSLANLLTYLQGENVIVVAAAGNEMQDINFDPIYPAAASGDFDNLVTVGAYSYLNDPVGLAPELMIFSNYSSDLVNLAAYGATQTPLAESDIFHYPVGTSIAAPLVAKHLARFRAVNPEVSYNDIIQLFYASILSDAVLGAEVKDGLYLQLGCIDAEQPQP